MTAVIKQRCESGGVGGYGVPYWAVLPVAIRDDPRN